jgi:Homeodomain-like domain
METRRLNAARRFARGESQGAVAKALGVSRVSAHHWFHAWKAEGRAQGGGPRGPEAAVGGGAARDGRASAANGPAGARLQHRSVDLAEGRRSDRAADGRPTPSRPCLAAAAPAGMVAPAAHAASAGTRRAGDRGVEDTAVGAAKKNARRQRAWLVFEDESGSRDPSGESRPRAPDDGVITERSWAKAVDGRWQLIVVEGKRADTR